MNKIKRLILITLVIACVLASSPNAFASYTYKNSCIGTTNTFADTVNCTLVGTTVSSGDLVVVWAGWAIDSLTASVSDGTSSLTGKGVNPGTNWSGAHGQFFYILSSVATGTPTYTLTVTGAYGPCIVVYVFTPTAAVTYDNDVATESSVTSTSVDSTSITVGGSDELIVGGAMIENGPTVSAEAIGGTSATTNKINGYSGGFTQAGWYLEKTGSVAATATLSSSEHWLANEIGFKIAGGGGGTNPSSFLTLGMGD